MMNRNEKNEESRYFRYCICNIHHYITVSAFLSFYFAKIFVTNSIAIVIWKQEYERGRGESMPKLKPSMQEERNRIVRACIAGNKERLAIDDAALAVKVGVTKKTIQNKYHRPETYSLDEMQKVATVLKFTPIQAASVLLGRELTSKEIKEFILM